MNDLIHASLENCALRIEHGAKITVEGIMQAGKALKEARDLLPENKAFGEWREKRLPWLHRAAALRYLQVYERFSATALQHNVATDLGPTILFALAAPSTPDSVVETAIQKAESGEKVTVEEIKRLKEEARRATDLADSMAHDLDINRKRVKELESLPPSEIVKTVEVIPEDYDHIKNIAALATDSAAKLRKELEKVKAEIAQAVKDQVKARMDAVKKDVEIADARVVNRQKELEKIEAQLAKMNRSLADVKWHEEIILKHWNAINELSIDIGDLDHNPETAPRWMKLAVGFANAAKAIKMAMCDGKPFTEETWRGLSETGNVC